nr:DUF1566 domain-containing protein [Candidatus Electrothrix aestuarii]
MSSKDTTIGQYIDHGDGTITDTEIDLMWKRCLEGLSGVNCEEGEVETYTWDDAVTRFKSVEYAGYKDWRLPTIDELKTLVHCSKGGKTKRPVAATKGRKDRRSIRGLFRMLRHSTLSGPGRPMRTSRSARGASVSMAAVPTSTPATALTRSGWCAADSDFVFCLSRNAPVIPPLP